MNSHLEIGLQKQVLFLPCEHDNTAENKKVVMAALCRTMMYDVADDLRLCPSRCSM
jgi:hypothetical protein